MSFENIANVAIVALICLVVLTMLVVWHTVWVSRARIEDLESEIKTLKASLSRDHLNKGEIENVLLDLNAKIQTHFGYFRYRLEMGKDSPRMVQDIRTLKLTSDKHLFELQILSPNSEKRISALQALSAGVGDVESLRILSQAIQASEGRQRSEYVKFAQMLYSRLTGPVTFDPGTWTGR